jgi:uncharacterized protein YbjT (DUF2867 family)
MVLVVGATGLVGSEVCQRLAQSGEHVRALVRETSSPERVEALRSAGAELTIGDLKDPASLQRACQGVHAVVSTASATLSRQASDSIESVDGAGQLNLVRAAKNAGVERFVFVSFRLVPGVPFPLSDAKRAVEDAIADMNFTVIQASWFMEVWLSPALGFDYANAKARIFGRGTAPVSWVSFRDVAEMCVVALRHPAAARRIIEFGGPEALSALEVVRRFETKGGKNFELEYVSEEMLRAQYEQASNSMEQTFAGLMLGCAAGDAMDMQPVVDTFGVRLTSVDDYVRGVLGSSARA